MNDQIGTLNYEFTPDPMCGLEAVYRDSEGDYIRPIVGWITLIYVDLGAEVPRAEYDRSIMAAVMDTDGLVDPCNYSAGLIEVRPIDKTSEGVFK